MKAYQEYKETGIDYYGKLPTRWGIVSLKYVCYMKGRIGWQGLKQDEFTDEGPFLITGMNFQNGKIDWDACYHITQERFEEAPEIHIKEGDVLITKDGTIGKLLFIEYLPGPTSLNSHLLLLRPLADDFEPKYLYYLLKSESFIRYVDNVKTGTTFYGITQEAMGDFRMLLFDKTEQRAIADFLDRKTAQIDTLIAKKQRQIELLQEYRTALINQVVTKGLDPDAPMKDSGIEWLGEVPEHWDIRKLKYISKVEFSNVDKHTIEGEEPIRLCNYTDVYYNDFITPGMDFMPATALSREIEKFTLRKGDVLITKDSETWDDIAIPAYVMENIDGVLCGYHLAQIRPIYVDGKYLFWSFSSSVLNDQYKVSANGITRYGLGKFTLENSCILIPPLTEQRDIANYLDRKTALFNDLIAKEKRQIEYLQEYRTALISAAVTGKIDIRGE